ncbi:MAG: 3-isopropylmalate dehydrogenase [Spirochaetales bacterium]|nr:3-isopropylmalate dehydrogenase [Spirochaetales bacterium]
MTKKIVLIPGDGIGPEVVDSAVKVLDKITAKFGHNFEYENAYAGGAAIDKFGNPLPQAELDKCNAADAVLMGALGGPKWDNLPGDQRPEAGLLRLRKGMGVYANLRPAVIFPALKESSPLKSSVIGDGLDIMIVRELIGGIYFGKRGRTGDDSAYDTMEYSAQEVKRIGDVAFKIAQKRSGRLTSVDKANVLENSRVWRKAITDYSANYPDVELSHLYVDNAAMQLVTNPGQFDVIVTGNMFGDILSDEASVITGSIGMLPSASLGDGAIGLYEPVHGSAPDIAGKGIANPLATILSAAMMLRYSFDMQAEADAIESAVDAVLNEGFRTGDIAVDKSTAIGTVEMTNKVLEKI